jgi:hypothetical protein
VKVADSTDVAGPSVLLSFVRYIHNKSKRKCLCVNLQLLILGEKIFFQSNYSLVYG